MAEQSDPPAPAGAGQPPTTPPPAAESSEPKPDNIEAMRAALKSANKEAEKARLRIKELEDATKSESEKLAERLADAELRATKAQTEAMRLEVAISKGLTATQAKRLVGATVDELAADADDLLSSFSPPAGIPAGVPSRQPTPTLKPGGADPGVPEPELDKVLAKIPRL